jgi:hypothetical protein
MAVRGGATETADFVRRLEDKGVNCNDLIARLLSPIEFHPPIGGRTAFGYEATVLADFCDVVLEARNADRKRASAVDQAIS